MVGTPYFDGALGLAQAGVQPGRRMTYEFLAWPPGTHFYHSHAHVQAADGLKGMFIVDDPDDPYAAAVSVDEPLFFYEMCARRPPRRSASRAPTRRARCADRARVAGTIPTLRRRTRSSSRSTTRPTCGRAAR